MKQGQGYEMRVETVNVQATAVVKDIAFAQNIGQKIRAGSPKVYDGLKAINAPKPGLNMVLYLPDSGGNWNTAPGIPIEIGVLLNEPPPALGEPVVRSSLPAGRVVATTHWGAYDQLGAAHHAIHEWCAAHGYLLTWRNWEVYGHWSDDPAKRRTDVYYLLK